MDVIVIIFIVIIITLITFIVILINITMIIILSLFLHLFSSFLSPFLFPLPSPSYHSLPPSPYSPLPSFLSSPILHRLLLPLSSRPSPPSSFPQSSKIGKQVILLHQILFRPPPLSSIVSSLFLFPPPPSSTLLLHPLSISFLDLYCCLKKKSCMGGITLVKMPSSVYFFFLGDSFPDEVFKKSTLTHLAKGSIRCRSFYIPRFSFRFTEISYIRSSTTIRRRFS